MFLELVKSLADARGSAPVALQSIFLFIALSRAQHGQEPCSSRIQTSGAVTRSAKERNHIHKPWVQRFRGNLDLKIKISLEF